MTTTKIDPRLAAEPTGNFPLGFYEEFLSYLREEGIVALTYDSLFARESDCDHEAGYPSEFARWNRSRDRRRRYVLIQHDVDDRPDFTHRMIELERRYEIRSSIFIFNRRFSRTDPNPDYDVDHAHLLRAQADGFVVGYHQNALMLAGFDPAAAQEIYERDVAALRARGYRIEFVVPHGGMGVDVDGKRLHNVDVEIPPSLRPGLRWVYNRYGVRFADRWSDGGLRRTTDPERLARYDLMAFARAIRPGCRAFVLVHPQRWGWHVDPFQAPLLAAEPWYRAMCRRYDATHVIRAEPGRVGTGDDEGS